MTYYELGYERRDRLFSDYRTLYKEYYGVSMSNLKMRRKSLKMLLEIHD